MVLCPLPMQSSNDPLQSHSPSLPRSDIPIPLTIVSLLTKNQLKCKFIPEISKSLTIVPKNLPCKICIDLTDGIDESKDTVSQSGISPCSHQA